MSCFVYLLECNDRSLYCGCTRDLEKRLKLHNDGKASKYTRARLPAKLVYREKLETRALALKREMQIKSLSRKEKLALTKRT